MYAIQQHLFLIEDLKARLTLILRAGRDRDSFSDQEGLWQPSDSRTFYCTVMFVNRFKLLLRCLRFDNWHTRDERKLVDKFAAVSEKWDIFLRNTRRVCISGKCIIVYEQLVGYRVRIHGSTYMPSKQGCGSGYFSNASASTPIASASTNKKQKNNR